MTNTSLDTPGWAPPLFARAVIRLAFPSWARRDGRGLFRRRTSVSATGGAGVARRLAALAACGAVVAGCTDEPAQNAPPAAAAPSQSAAQAPPAASALEPAMVLGGWRDLKFGMSEADVKKLIYQYRKSADVPWERSKEAGMPIVRFGPRQIDDAPADEKRFHRWGIRELDDGAEFVHAWHDRGALVAVQIKGKTTPEAFVRKASEAYGTQPQKASFKFFDRKKRIQQSREVSFWRGADATAFVWSVASTPVLLVWSNAAMDAIAAEYQTALDAPAAAASRAARVSEDGTKF